MENTTKPLAGKTHNWWQQTKWWCTSTYQADILWQIKRIPEWELNNTIKEFIFYYLLISSDLTYNIFCNIIQRYMIKIKSRKNIRHFDLFVGDFSSNTFLWFALIDLKLHIWHQNKTRRIGHLWRKWCCSNPFFHCRISN